MVSVSPQMKTARLRAFVTPGTQENAARHSVRRLIASGSYLQNLTASQVSDPAKNWNSDRNALESPIVEQRLNVYINLIIMKVLFGRRRREVIWLKPVILPGLSAYLLRLSAQACRLLACVICTGPTLQT